MQLLELFVGYAWQVLAILMVFVAIVDYLSAIVHGVQKKYLYGLMALVSVVGDLMVARHFHDRSTSFALFALGLFISIPYIVIKKKEIKKRPL
ncbi:MAG: hypothetical protein WAV25_01405 [Minisyncoccia bacterium]